MKYLLLFIVFIFCAGCANVVYTAPGGEKFSYTRLGIQKINGFDMQKNDQGLIKVKFESQEGTAGDLAETMKNLSEALAKMP